MSEESNEIPLSGGAIEHGDIIKMIPHRYPFLLVDRILDWSLEPEKIIHAIKNVTVNEPFFPGHFPGNPVMPGVLIIEAMAQTAGVLANLSSTAEKKEGSLYYLVKVDKAKFTKIVVPGDQLLMEVIETRRMRNMGMFSCQATINDKKVASCQLLCAGKS